MIGVRLGFQTWATTLLMVMMNDDAINLSMYCVLCHVLSMIRNDGFIKGLMSKDCHQAVKTSHIKHIPYVLSHKPFYLIAQTTL